MKLIICLDDNNGILFNNRRQSRDRVVVEKINSIADGAGLFMTEYSKKLFGENQNIALFSGDLPLGGEQDFFFAEQGIAALDDYSEIYVFRWNRLYPSDVKFDFDLETEGFRLRSAEDLIGSSHDKITFEIYERG